jgi:predicted dehydrogenase
LIGVGNHVRDMLLPHLQASKRVDLRWVCTGTGLKANALASRLNVERRSVDFHDVIADPETNAVLVGTRHGSHAQIVLAALRAGVHVFVEKPLCLTLEELAEIQELWPACEKAGLRLLVGFNRRHSPHALKARELFAGRREPLVMTYRVNAGLIPREHWVHDPVDGGGRIIGEACHFLDFMQFVCGSPPISVRGRAIASHSSGITEDQSVLTFGFADGSVGTIIYAAGGDGSLEKERLEIFGASRALVLDDFVTTHMHRDGEKQRFTTGKRDKGFASEMAHFEAAVIDGVASALNFQEIVAVSRGCILAARSLVTGDEYNI